MRKLVYNIPTYHLGDGLDCMGSLDAGRDAWWALGSALNAPLPTGPDDGPVAELVFRAAEGITFGATPEVGDPHPRPAQISNYADDWVSFTTPGGVQITIAKLGTIGTLAEVMIHFERDSHTLSGAILVALSNSCVENSRVWVDDQEADVRRLAAAILLVWAGRAADAAIIWDQALEDGVPDPHPPRYMDEYPAARTEAPAEEATP